jgi:hypothetical protein
MEHPSDLLATAIFGPWVKSTLSTARRQHVYLTLAHWYEGAKFMPHKPELREEVLFTPTLKELRKLARAKQTLWRPDWQITRHTVLIAGLGMLALQRPELKLHTCSLDLLREGLQPMQLPEKFVTACFERFDVWRRAPRITTFGADAAPESIVGTKMAKLVAPMPTWTLLAACDRRAPWRVHDWALTHYVPVQYVGEPGGRMSRPLAQKLVDLSDQVVVFEQRRDRKFDYVLQLAKRANKRISLELYDGQDSRSRQLDGLR